MAPVCASVSFDGDVTDDVRALLDAWPAFTPIDEDVAAGARTLIFQAERRGEGEASGRTRRGAKKLLRGEGEREDAPGR